jgi:hypothetical protein
MDPTSAWAWERRGYVRQGHAFSLRSGEEADAAIHDFHRAMRFRGPGMPRANFLHGIASAHYAAGRFQQAADWARKATAENLRRTGCTSCCAVVPTSLAIRPR